MPRMKITIRILFVLVSVVLAIAGIGLYLQYRLPSTADMETFFHEHRAELERRNIEVLAAAGDVESGPDPRAGYRFLEVRREPPRAVRYFTHLRGIGVSAFGTGIAWLESPPEKVYSSLEAMLDDSAMTERFIGYGRLEGSWYYFLWEAD